MSKVSRLGASSTPVRGQSTSSASGGAGTSISAGIMLVAVIGLFGRGLNYGIEFEGGVEFQAITDNPSDKIEDVTDAVVGTEIEAASNPVVVASDNTGTGTRPSGCRPSR